MKKIILASASPRRKKLLEKTGLKFKVVKSKIAEIYDFNMRPCEIVEKLSLQKAKYVFEKYKDSTIIAADTLVALDNKILGKPKNKEDAKKMLLSLSGKKHFLITGFTIIHKETIITKSEKTEITMRKIAKAEIDSYLKTNEPFDKAGAYAIQGEAKKFIKKIEGSIDNAVGLPISSVFKALKALGIKTPKSLFFGIFCYNLIVKSIF